MSLKRRTFTSAFKLRVVREIEAGKTPAQAAREHELHPNLISNWRKRYGQCGADAFEATPPNAERRQAELERLIGQLTIENAFLARR